MNAAQLAELVGGSGDVGENPTITDLVYDSREVTAGSALFCLPGRVTDGHRFARDAAARGAVLVICEHATGAGVPEIVVADARKAMNSAAGPFYGNPSREMKLFGVTGTNGKTTVSFFVEAIARAAGAVTGLVGTVETRVASEVIQGSRTTPESVDLQRLLARMVEASTEVCAMEVTSVGIAEGRVDGCWFEVAAFTNLTQDHLDYHGDMETYYRSKRALFEPDLARIAVVNIDDPAGHRIIKETSMEVVSFGVEDPADLMARQVKLGAGGSSFVLTGLGLDVEIEMSIPGPFNVSNAVCAAGSAHLMGVDPGSIAEGLRLAGIPGRFEPVQAGQPFAVIVDYAHTPDSLENVLKAGRRMTDGKLIVVFGCGGDRDKAKRPQMGRIAGELADVVFATSDNPRSEDPQEILDQVKVGLDRTEPPGGAHVIVDRTDAIRAALMQAQPGDVVIIAGKGHETGQEARGVKTPFDDRQVAAMILGEMT